MLKQPSERRARIFILGNQTMGQRKDATLSLLVLTRPCALVDTDWSLTLSFTHLTLSGL